MGSKRICLSKYILTNTSIIPTEAIITADFKLFYDIPRDAKNFLSYLSNIKGKSESTVNEYYYDLRTFFRFMKCHRGMASFDDFEKIECGDIDTDFIRGITLDDMYEYLMYANSDRDNNANARARKVSSLKSFFNYLSTKAHLLQVNITKELDSPKIPSKLPVFLSLDESRKLLENIDGEFKVRDYCIITLFLNCGMRLSELVGINISDIHGDRLTVTGKGNKQRTVYLNEACRAAIRQYMEVRPTDSAKDRRALFLSKQKTRISNNMVYRMVKKNLERAGLDTNVYSPHKLRHTAATLMYKYGSVDVRALQEILGHEHLSTTQIYTHIDEQQLRDAIDKNPLAHVTLKKE